MKPRPPVEILPELLPFVARIANFLRPPLITALRPSLVNHMIPRRTPTQRFPARIMHPPATEPLFRLRHKHPVHKRVRIAQIEARAVPHVPRDLRLVAIREFVEGSCFDNGDVVHATFGEAVRKNETGCAAADDDEVVGCVQTGDGEGGAEKSLACYGVCGCGGGCAEERRDAE